MGILALADGIHPPALTEQVQFYGSREARERVRQQLEATSENDLYRTVRLPVTQLFREDRGTIGRGQALYCDRLPARLTP